MIRILVVVVAILASARSWGASPDEVAERVTQVQQALLDWQIDEAASVAAELARETPDVPAVQAVIGAVKFHQGDYEGAVRLLRRAADAGERPGLLPLAESTLEETRGFVSSQSAHFIVRTPAGKDEVLHSIALWALEEAYREVSAAFDYRPRHKIPVDILHDARGLSRVSTLTEKEIETSGTIALCKFNRLMITSPKALARGYSWLDTLSHEFIHLIVSEKSHNTVPIWLHEGLAKYNESRWRGPPGLALDPASENLLAKGTKSGKLITFEQMHPSMAKLPSQEDTALAFAEVFSVIEYIEGTGKTVQGKRATNALLEALRDGNAMDDALQAALDSDLQGLQQEWKAWLKRRPFKLVPGAEPRKLTFVKNARRGGAAVEEVEDETALAEASDKGHAGRQYVRLGNMLRERRRLKAASAEYEKAIAIVGVQSPALHNRLAGVLLEVGDVGKAKKVLLSTVAVFPDDPQTHVLLGRAALRDENWAEAKRHYQRATWEAPVNAEIQCALWTVAKRLGDAGWEKESTRALSLLSGHERTAPADSALFVAEGAPAGTLSLATEPWGRVIINGIDSGLTTPLVDQPLRVGKHRIRGEDPVGGRGEGADIVIVAGQASRLELTLRALTDEQRRALLAAEEAQRERAPPPRPRTKKANLEPEQLPPWSEDLNDDEDGVLEPESSPTFPPLSPP